MGSTGSIGLPFVAGIRHLIMDLVSVRTALSLADAVLVVVVVAICGCNFRVDIPMVKSVISYKINGLSNWMVQRISALIMTAYLIFMVGYFVVIKP